MFWGRNQTTSTDAPRGANFVSRGILAVRYTASNGFRSFAGSFAGAGRRGGFFVSKIAATVLALLGCTLFAVPMSAQLIPHGNVYAGGALSRTEFVIPTNQYHLKGFEGSGEAMP